MNKNIIAAIERGKDAWNAVDLEGYLATYAEESRYVSGGTLFEGKAAIGASFRSRFDRPEKMGQLEIEHLQVDIATEEDGLVFGRIGLTRDGQVHRGVFTVHVRRFGDEWLIVSDHS
ncbi:MAG: DUF4440 domain-containing protein [Chloroflexota bacterium]